MINETQAAQPKKAYETPTLTTWGTVADLTGGRVDSIRRRFPYLSR